METLFAIGVILVGLLGLAAVIPVAARQAQDTLRADRSTADATSIAQWLQSIDIRQRFYVVDDDIRDNYRTYSCTVNSVDVDDNGNVTGYDATLNFKSQVGRYRLESMIARKGEYMYDLTAARFNPRFDPSVRHALDSPGFSKMTDVIIGSARFPFRSKNEPGIYAGFCIDPRFIPPGDPSAPASMLRYSCFPYYAPETNPFLPPQAAQGTSVQWAYSPRLWRMGEISGEYTSDFKKADLFKDEKASRWYQYTYTDNSTTPPTQQTRYLPYWTVIDKVPYDVLAMPSRSLELDNRYLFHSDRIWQKPESDDSLNTNAYFRASMVSGSNGPVEVPGGRISQSHYSWIATICPYPANLGAGTGGSHELSVVVLERRDIPNLHTATASGVAPPQERLTWVGKYAGFTGGTGGDITIYGSNAISNEVKKGSWVMLSRQAWGLPPSFTPVPYFGNPTGTSSGNARPSGPSVHRWYRVVDASDPLPDTTPHGGNVWSRRLTLAGPDWTFGTYNGSGFLERESGTFCTLVDGAIDVVTTPIDL